MRGSLHAGLFSFSLRTEMDAGGHLWEPHRLPHRGLRIHHGHHPFRLGDVQQVNRKSRLPYVSYSPLSHGSWNAIKLPG